MQEEILRQEVCSGALAQKGSLRQEVSSGALLQKESSRVELSSGALVQKESFGVEVSSGPLVQKESLRQEEEEVSSDNLGLIPPIVLKNIAPFGLDVKRAKVVCRGLELQMMALPVALFAMSRLR